MYSVSRSHSLFTGAAVVYVFKAGELFAIKRVDGWHIIKQPHAPIELSRAQGYRYWERYFSGLSCYDLPNILQEAIDKPCKTEIIEGNRCYCG